MTGFTQKKFDILTDNPTIVPQFEYGEGGTEDLRNRVATNFDSEMTD